tara:strand:- start:24 stop:911 length:888 start_codon:yes stop_codon:yes gene_type:complete
MVNSIFKALSSSKVKFSKIVKLLSKDSISNQEIDNIEEMLIEADLGYDLSEEIIGIIKNQSIGNSDLTKHIKLHLKNILNEHHNQLSIKEQKAAILIVGVNGSGKTTSAAKLAGYYSSLGRKVSLIAADTYRAAAVDQLRIWSERVGCKFIYNEESTDPASVVFNGLESANTQNESLAIIDTAGRLHTKGNLMNELAKINRMIENRFPQFLKISLITIDASIGQNSIVQAEEFRKSSELAGAIITKLDGTAKGGVVFPLYDKLKIPVNFVGVGEGIRDLKVFEPNSYVDGIMESI